MVVVAEFPVEALMQQEVLLALEALEAAATEVLLALDVARGLPILEEVVAVAAIKNLETSIL